MYSQTIAAADPAPFYKPRFIRWPSVSDTTRTNWVNPSAEPQPPAPVQSAETFTTYVGCHLHSPSLQPGEPLPVYLQNIETLCTSLATPAQQAAFAACTFSADAAPPPLPEDLRETLYSTIDCGPGLPPPPKSRRSRASDKPPKKLGRPAIFDEIMRAKFCAMVQSGCTLRYAAKRLGISRGTVIYACRTDPDFADRLRRAEQERDLTAVGRIQNAGEKSWRAAAWLLERNAPEEFSLRHPSRDPVKRLQKHLGKRRFKQLLTDAAREVNPNPELQASSGKSNLPKPKPPRPTPDVIQAQINELLLTLPPDERYNVMDALGY